MKGIMKIGIALTVCALVAALPASATCGIADNRTFGGYAYFSGFSSTATLLGSFWQVGNFGGANNGNGTYEASAWNLIGPNGLYINGNWAADATIVGCPTAPPASVKMAYVVSSPDGSGGTVYAAGCATSDALSGNFAFGTSIAGTTIPSQLIPKPNVTGSTRQGGGTSIDINVAAPVVPGGVLDEGACGLTPTSYRVYARVVPRDGPAPTDRGRISGAWTAVGGPTPIGSPSTVNVLTPGNVDIYLAYGIIFPDGVETEHVGTNSTTVQGGATSSNQPNDFKIIKKPIKRPAGVN
jgi:hypothetical protein